MQKRLRTTALQQREVKAFTTYPLIALQKQPSLGCLPRLQSDIEQAN